MYKKNVSGQFIHVQGVDAVTNGIKTGVSWTVRRCIDGTFAAATGTATEDGTTGWYKFAMSQADTNGNNIGFNFTGTGAIPQTVNIVTDGAPPDVNVTQIDGQATNGNNATLNLKKLSIVQSAGGGDAVVLTGGAASGATPAGHGMKLTGGAASTTVGGTAGNGILSTGGQSDTGGAPTTNDAAEGASFVAGGGYTVAAGGVAGLKATGSRFGAGLETQGGIQGPGTKVRSGSVDGHGIDIGATDGNAIRAVSAGVDGGRDAVYIEGGPYGTDNGGGAGIKIKGGIAGNGTLAGDGIIITGGAAGPNSGEFAGSGISGTGGAGSATRSGGAGLILGGGVTGGVAGGMGVQVTAGSAAHALWLRGGAALAGGTAGGDGIRTSGGAATTAGAAGHGINTNGGNASTSAGGTAGKGINALGGSGAATTNGAAAGATITAGGTTTVSGNDGVQIAGTGNGDGLQCAGAGTGVDIRGNITGNLVGTINGLTATALADFFDTNSGTTYGAAVAGSVVKEIADTNIIESGTAQSGGNRLITLAAGATSASLRGHFIRIYGGTGAGQVRLIMRYNGTTKVAIIDTPWTTNPDATSTYAVLNTRDEFAFRAFTGKVLASDAVNTLQFDTFANGSIWPHDLDKGGMVYIVFPLGTGNAEPNACQGRFIKINSYGDNGGDAARTINVSPDWTNDPTGYDYVIVPSAGVDVKAVGSSVNIPSGPNSDGRLLASVQQWQGVNVATPAVAGIPSVDVVSIGATARAQVNAEVVDALATDTYAEPGQGTPAATTTLAAKLNYLYKAWRNRSTQTASQYSLYADNATTVDQKATFSDDATTADRGEVATGP